MLRNFRKILIISTMSLLFFSILSLFTNIEFVHFLIAIAIGVPLTYFIEYNQNQSKWMVFVRKYV